MRFRNILISSLVVLCAIVLKYGLKKLFLLIFGGLVGYFLAHLVFKSEFLWPSLFNFIGNHNSTDSKKNKKPINASFKLGKNSLKVKQMSSRTSSDDSTIQSPAEDDASNLDFEKFRNAYPWKGVYLPENVDRSLENIFSLVIRHFVLTWYTTLSSDDGLVHEIKVLLRHVVACFIIRLEKVNIENFISFKLNTILFNHLNEFKEHLAKNNIGLEELRDRVRMKAKFEVLNSLSSLQINQVHLAMYSRQHELEYLRKCSFFLLEMLLPETYKHRSSMNLVNEILVSNVFLRGLDILAETSTLNQLLIRLVSKSKALDREVSPGKRVQLLKHWCQMNGCIFKSCSTPSLKEVLENTEILRHFIAFLNSQESIIILQVHQQLKDIIYKSSSKTNYNVTIEIERLKKLCKEPSNQQILQMISFQKEVDLYEALTKILSQYENDTTSPRNDLALLNEVYAEFNALIKDVYYPSFIKSEYVFRYLIGEKNERGLSAMKKSLIETSRYSSPKKSSNELSNSRLSRSMIYTSALSPPPTVMSRSSVQQARETKNDIDMSALDDIGDYIDCTSINFPTGDEPDSDIRQYSSDEHEEDLSEDSGDNLSIISSTNLNNLKISIDDVEELLDKNGKWCYVFVIRVWNAKEAQRLDNIAGECCASWTVKRKYDEFYVLDSRLKEFHGILEKSDAHLPSKQRNLFGNSRNIDYLRSIKSDFEKYIQSLLNNQKLALSELIRTFLDPQSIEFSSSIFNDITNIGKIVKGVPLKLRLERGQSLDAFLQSLVKLTEQSKPKSSRTYVAYEDIIASKLENNEYVDKNMNLQRDEASEDYECFNFTPFDSLLYFVVKLYKVPSFIGLVLFSIRKLVFNSFNSFFTWLIKRKLNEITQPSYIAFLIDSFNDLIFGDIIKNDAKSNEIISHALDTPGSDKNDEEHSYEKTYDAINSFVFDDLLNFLFKHPFVYEKLNESFKEGNRLILELFQYPIWNKHLSYKLLDALIEELFTEVNLIEQ